MPLLAVMPPPSKATGSVRINVPRPIGVSSGTGRVSMSVTQDPATMQSKAAGMGTA